MRPARHRVARFEILEDRRLLAIGSLDEFWHALDTIPPAEAGQQSFLRTTEFEAFRLDRAQLEGLLADAPREFTAAKPLEVGLPNPDGQLARFEIFESPVMAPGLAEQFPNIKTYRGQGIDDPAATIRFDVTPAGLHAQVLSPEGSYYIDPYYHLDDGLYATYYVGSGLSRPEFQEWEPLVAAPANSDAFHTGSASKEPAPESLSGAAGKPANQAKSSGPVSRSGTELRTYRTAVAATGEYTAFHGGTVTAGQAAIVTAINRVTGIYENELSIRLELVANNNSLVYTDANNDPYSNDNASALLAENQTNIDNVIGDANYDLGHVFTTGGGGLAGLGVVGISGRKAQGETGLSNPVGDPFFVDFVAHEIGHQFNANHTFNGDSGSCAGGNRSGNTAYEPGSGSTIMAYAGICGDDNLQTNSDDYFHSVSFDEIISFVDTTIPGVGVRTATGNNVPVVEAGNNFVIPASTPFTLTASGTDGDSGDVLTYNWEQRDLGPQQDVNAGDNGSSPLFRSFAATNDPSRTFPRLSDLLNNTTVVGETLPTQDRTMQFRVTVRDNRSGGGGVNTDDLTVRIEDSAGPFRVTAPTAVNWPAQSTQTVSWDVAGTTANGINTSTVNILLSTDGGSTFPTVLAAGTPNDGSENIVLPNTPSSAARIKVEAVGNVFFDLSNANFTISPSVSTDDFGDAPDGPYPTLLANNGARHVAGGPQLGTIIDTETDGQPNATATGDGADEDGVRLVDPLIAGTTVNVEVSSPGGGALDYFFDFDKAGGFGNQSNEIFSAALSGGTELVPVVIPSGTEGDIFARFRISTSGGLGPSGGAPDGEVEDYLFRVFATAPPVDFGDAADPDYATLLASNGARHLIAGPRLGTAVDAEADGQPNATATGDGRDDDGVIFQQALLRGTTAQVTVTSSAGGGVLDYFFDFDRDGTFGNQANEVFQTTLAGGTEQVPVIIPASAALGTTYARFRLSTTGGLTAGGLSQDGEVEDYQVVVIAPVEVCTTVEHFDGVTAPALPSGWATATTGSNPFSTLAGNSDTPPNHAFVANVASVSDNSLTSPPLAITAANSRLKFRNHYAMEPGFDGGVLEISIAGGQFTDFVASGGSFLAGGYTGSLDTGFQNPLGGRQAWTGNSGGFIDTIADLPAAANGQNVALRWRQGTDSSVPDTGWRVDTIQLCGNGIGGADYGDAPDPSYPTLAASNGAAHVAGPLFLGAGVDVDPDGQPHGSAQGDDTDSDGDDEDVGTSLFTPGELGSLEVTASTDTLINVWLDWNDDGDWADAGEQVFKDAALTAGTNTLNFQVPSSAPATALTFGRVRASNQAGLSFDGQAGDGEVEDFSFAIGESGGNTPQVRLTVNDTVIGENGGVATFTATLSAIASSPVTVSLGFSGTATLATDYTASATEIVIPPGSLSGSVTVTAIQDSLTEADETVIADITGVSNGTELGTQRQITTIADDDETPTVSLSVNDTEIGENGGVATFTASLSVPAPAPVTVALGFSGTATHPGDYIRSDSQIVIGSGNTSGFITVAAVQDVVDEVDETVVVQITSATGATVGGAAQQTTTILDDDSASLLAPRVTNQLINGTGINNRSAIARLILQFDQAVTVAGVTALRLFNHSDGTAVDISAASLQDNGSPQVSWDLTSVSLPDGYYTAELRRTDAVSVAGSTPLTATHSFSFHKLAGDSNGSGDVGFADFGELANHFNLVNGPVLGPGDLNGDGNVNFGDFGVLAAGFNQQLTFPELDFGDAPEIGTSFLTTQNNNGPRHIVGGGLQLGATIDGETDGQPDSSASGDGADEDGLTIPTLVIGASVNVSLTAVVPAAAVINGWIDFNANGNWDDAGEQVLVDHAIVNGTNTIQLDIPAWATAGPAISRFRITSGGGYSYQGLAVDGEVEDYQVTIAAPFNRPSAGFSLSTAATTDSPDAGTDPSDGTSQSAAAFAERVDKAVAQLAAPAGERPDSSPRAVTKPVSTLEADQLMQEDLLDDWL